jgi:hypothetical protein
MFPMIADFLAEAGFFRKVLQMRLLQVFMILIYYRVPSWMPFSPSLGPQKRQAGNFISTSFQNFRDIGG